MEDQKKHNGISLKEKLITLMKPSNMIKLVLVQQHELERICLVKRINKAIYSPYIEQLYQHYIVEGKPKTFIC